MKSPTVADLKASKANGGLFLVQSKDVREGKTGKKYMSLTLMDSTGEIDARMWDNVETVSGLFERDDFIRVEGEHRNTRASSRLIVHRLKKAPDDEVELQDFLPASKRDTGAMFAELQSIVAGIGNPHLKALLEAILSDARIAGSFRVAPAAKSIHHAWLGGLIEHVLSMCELSRRIGQHYIAAGYPVDLDLLLAGAILHDIGKIDEVELRPELLIFDSGAVAGTHRHRRADHRRQIARPSRFSSEAADAPGAHDSQPPPRTAFEFGSPKLPVFMEALLLAQIDNMDSKMAIMLSSVEKDRDAEAEWTGYNQALERQVLDKTSFLQERPAALPADAGPSASSAKVPGGAQTRPRQATAIGSALMAALGGKPGDE